MNYINILNECTFCVNSASAWFVAGSLLIVFRIIVPILIIIFGVIDFGKSVVTQDDNSLKNNISFFVKRLAAGVIIFFIPTIISVAMNMVAGFSENSANFSDCTECLNNPFGDYCQSLKRSRVSLCIMNEEYEHYVPGNFDPPDSDNGGSSDGNGTVLILAGHSYEPYCSKISNECRGTWPSSGYDETTETRKLAVKLKQQLSAVGIKADIANQLLSDDGDSKMSTSFLVERSTNYANFSKYDWTKYSYAIELHFNGSGGNGASGSVVVLNSGLNAGIPIDKDILEAVTKYTGNSNMGYYNVNTGNFSYFKSIGVPFTYLEVEFYDNKAAMSKYTNNIDNIAREMAQVIRKYYR